MIDENRFDINEWLNAYPKKNGISRKYSPAAIVQGKGPVNVDTLTVTFGAYCEVYKETKNDSTPRTESAIALRPCNNEGEHFFMSLRTGRRFRGLQWTELAIPEWVINRVREIADNEHAPKLDAEGCPVFQIDQDVPLPHDFYEEYEPDEQEYETGEHRDDADGEEQVEIAEDNIALDDKNTEIERDDMTLF